MFDILVVLAIYTVVVLLVVPLEKIGKWQESVKCQVKKWTDKV